MVVSSNLAMGNFSSYFPLILIPPELPPYTVSTGLLHGHSYFIPETFPTMQDDNGTTPLHLAALCGWLECVETLISHQHQVACRDDTGWPPLLYAHFQNHQDCVLALMKAEPQQVS